MSGENLFGGLYPLAYLVTSSGYGAHLRGHLRGSVDSDHNGFGAPQFMPNWRRERTNRRLLSNQLYVLSAARRAVVLEAIKEVCRYRHWGLGAAHVRSTHVHSVVEANVVPETILRDFKAYSSRRLAQVDPTRRIKRWSRGGSKRYLWTVEDVEAAIHYVLFEQGRPMEVHYGEKLF